MFRNARGARFKRRNAACFCIILPPAIIAFRLVNRHGPGTG